jgi:uncharacterized protein (DUF1778 family)
LSAEQWEKFQAELDAPPRDNWGLHKLLKSPVPFDPSMLC